MTENTPKKPRRKRRTKAQIAAEKAAQAPKEVKTDDVIVEMFEESVIDPVDVKEDTVESVKSTDCDTCGGGAADAALAAAEANVEEEPAKDEPEPYVPLTGLAKIKARMEQRKLRRMSAGL